MTTIHVPTWAMDKITLVRIIRTINQVEENLKDEPDRVKDPQGQQCLADCLAELACYPKPKLKSRVPKGTAFKPYYRDEKLVTPRRRY